MPLDLEHDLTKLRGAEYNPRRITAEDEAALDESVTSLGIVKPVIARGDLIVAGHQRTKAARRLGITRGPVYQLPCEVTTYDEVRFNQLHNGTDADAGDESARYPGGFSDLGYQVVDGSRITGNFKGRLAVVRTEIAGLILKYGPWGGVVATRSGQVIHCAQYALAAKLTNTPLTVFVIPDDRADDYRRRLSKTYGVFNYDHLGRRTYVQLMAQVGRLRPNDKGGSFKSALYETMVMPWLAQHQDAEILDFGSGHGDYAAMLRKKNRKVSDLELFRRAARGLALDVNAIRRMVHAYAGRVASGRLYDAVVCDSVLNSVDTVEAEAAVMTMINASVRVGSPVFFSGRTRERLKRNLDRTQCTPSVRNNIRYIEFLDEHGFSAMYRKGSWFYQKFHSKEEVQSLCDHYGLRVVKHVHSPSGSFQVHAIKYRDLPNVDVLKAVDYEFNLPISTTQRLGMHQVVRGAFEQLDREGGRA